jgi:hypothetical protein
MGQESAPNGRRPGRPAKFGRPSRVVAFTLPEDAIDRLRQVHRDVGWAIVKLLDTQAAPRSAPKDLPHDVELVTVADRCAMIVVNQEVIRNLPGVNIIPLGGNRAFLALDIDRGLSDLELAASDRLADGAIGRRERQALATLQAQLRTWRSGVAISYTRDHRRRAPRPEGHRGRTQGRGAPGRAAPVGARAGRARPLSPLISPRVLRTVRRTLTLTPAVSAPRRRRGFSISFTARATAPKSLALPEGR